MFSSLHRLNLVPAGDDPRIDRFRALLGESKLFRGVAPTALDDLARRLQVRSRKASALVVAQDEPGEAMYVIFSGSVKIALFGESGREVTLATLGPGDHFGELSLLDGRPRSANAVALEDTTLLVLTRETFADHVARHPRTALNLLAELARRLRRADETIADLALGDVHARLVRALERLARDAGEETAEGLIVRRRPTQQDLANMIGACRETVSRSVTSLVASGLLVPRGRALLLTRRLLAGERAAS